MLKECIVIVENELPTQVYEIKHFDPQSFLLLKGHCVENKAKLDKEYKEKEKELKATIESLQKQINILKAEIQFDRGELTQEEYENVVGINS